ncbi:MAG: trehalose-6-phosphate synthase [Cyanobacteria bacterium]|nr:trehalose-6-phosphate synthase [Cyanobacteriota bacterium]
MRIVSYRGPTAPGGVATAISRVFDQYERSGEWWFVRDHRLVRKVHSSNYVEKSLEPQLVDRHYRFCNNFLWPIMHDMPDLAHFDDLEWQSYVEFNHVIGDRLKCVKGFQNEWFINDYQFSLVPGRIGDYCPSFVFWHIPWPRNVRHCHVEPLVQVAQSLLRTTVIGFHTNEYRDNFLRFIDSYIPEAQLGDDECVGLALGGERARVHRVKIVVAPLGIDIASWNGLASRACATRFVDAPYVLSVDRCDFTKGISERFSAIEEFFLRYPNWLERVSFLQVITRSRKGLPEFDKYWTKCRLQYAALNSRLAKGDWQPVIWLDKSRQAGELAGLYREASAMLVSPLRDGLNLTAKEFVACQSTRSGVLALSSGAGVFEEFFDGCIAVEPTQSTQFADAIARSLSMSDGERIERTTTLRARLLSNTLENWWRLFRNQCQSRSMATPIELVRQSIDAAC